MANDAFPMPSREPETQTEGAGEGGSAELAGEALEAAREISDERWRVRTLGTLAPRLPPAERREVLAAALKAARAISDESLGAHAFGALARRRPAELADAALKAALEIRDERLRAHAFGALAPTLPR